MRTGTNASATPPARLLGTLAGAGSVAGALVVLMYISTAPVIQAHRAAAIEAAIFEVLPHAERYVALYPHAGRLVDTLPTSPDPEVVYAGFDSHDRLIGFGIPARGPGFQDPIELLFGFDVVTGQTLGVTILSSRETPGLGDKIQGDAWRAQFRGIASPITGIKRGPGSGSKIVMITGATISSRAVIAAINAAVDHWQPLLRGYTTGGAR